LTRPCLGCLVRERAALLCDARRGVALAGFAACCAILPSASADLPEVQKFARQRMAAERGLAA